ncbi:helix-turn-helix domain-containing protein [Actinopolyspora saharensis]|uniref:transposase family protein n=1 Tax=Actinopolyspora saharensis TaxID=995062 RepID=UPI0011142868
MRYQIVTGRSGDQLCWLAGRVDDHIRWDPRNTLSVFIALVVTLESYRTNLTQKQLAAFRNTSQSAISRVLRRIEPVLAEIVDEIHASLEEFHGRVTLVDGALLPHGKPSCPGDTALRKTSALRRAPVRQHRPPRTTSCLFGGDEYPSRR